MALKARSDWLVKLRISFPIYLRATREKNNDKAVAENREKATKFGFAVFKGYGLGF